tara:strand:- start:1025 stop:1321 length:297 start_codon:yes stop_codon:yes gene_type:complete
LIPFAYNLEKDGNTRRMVEKKLHIKNKWQDVSYCELNYCANMSRQILKVVREKSYQVEDRNIGFGFIFFNGACNNLLKRMFKGNFKKMKQDQIKLDNH